MLESYDWYHPTTDATVFEDAATIPVAVGTTTTLALVPTARTGGSITFTLEDATTGSHPTADCLTVTAHEAVSGIGVGMSAATDSPYLFELESLPAGPYHAVFVDFGGPTCDGTDPTYHDQWYSGMDGTGFWADNLLPPPGIETADPVVVPAGSTAPVHFVLNAFDPVIGCGYVATTSVTLTEDLRCSGDGLIVGADGIEIDLNGFTVRNVGPGAPTGVVVDGHADVTVRNGTVRGFHSNVSFVDSPRGVVEDLVVREGDSGLAFLRSPESTATRVVARSNYEGGFAVTASDDVVLSDIVGAVEHPGCVRAVR